MYQTNKLKNKIENCIATKFCNFLIQIEKNGGDLNDLRLQFMKQCEASLNCKSCAEILTKDNVWGGFYVALFMSSHQIKTELLKFLAENSNVVQVACFLLNDENVCYREIFRSFLITNRRRKNSLGEVLRNELAESSCSEVTRCRVENFLKELTTPNLQGITQIFPNDGLIGVDRNVYQIPGERFLPPVAHSSLCGRVSSFISFDHDVIAPHTPTDFAKSGFYCSGKNHNLICYCCGCKETHPECYTATFKSWHLENCCFKSNTECCCSLPKGQVKYSCKYPCHKTLTSTPERKRTFPKEFDNYDAPHSSKQQFADAGFCFIGGCMRCFYCRCNLKSWETCQHPWEAHAICFPVCKFLLHHKGPDFMTQTNKRHIKRTRILKKWKHVLGNVSIMLKFVAQTKQCVQKHRIARNWRRAYNTLMFVTRTRSRANHRRNKRHWRGAVLAIKFINRLSTPN